MKDARASEEGGHAGTGPNQALEPTTASGGSPPAFGSGNRASPLRE
jgi:hypothetical protein